MNKIHLVILLALMFSATVKADDWRALTARVFSSSDGTAAIKIVPAPTGFSDSTGTVFRLERDGSEKVVWSQKLVNAPVSVFVWQGIANGLHSTCVVTLDSWGSVGYKHVIVVYDENGQVLLDSKLEDILTLEEIKKHVMQSRSSRWWRNNATTEFDGIGDSAKFIIKLSWGKVISVNLKDGEIQTSTTTPK